MTCRGCGRSRGGGLGDGFAGTAGAAFAATFAAGAGAAALPLTGFAGAAGLAAAGFATGFAFATGFFAAGFGAGATFLPAFGVAFLPVAAFLTAGRDGFLPAGLADAAFFVEARAVPPAFRAAAAVFGFALGLDLRVGFAGFLAMSILGCKRCGAAGGGAMPPAFRRRQTLRGAETGKPQMISRTSPSPAGVSGVPAVPDDRRRT